MKDVEQGELVHTDPELVIAPDREAIINQMRVYPRDKTVTPNNRGTLFEEGVARVVESVIAKLQSEESIQQLQRQISKMIPAGKDSVFTLSIDGITKKGSQTKFIKMDNESDPVFTVVGLDLLIAAGNIFSQCQPSLSRQEYEDALDSVSQNESVALGHSPKSTTSFQFNAHVDVLPFFSGKKEDAIIIYLGAEKRTRQSLTEQAIMSAQAGVGIGSSSRNPLALNTIDPSSGFVVDKNKVPTIDEILSRSKKPQYPNVDTHSAQFTLGQLNDIMSDEPSWVKIFQSKIFQLLGPAVCGFLRLSTPKDKPKN